MPAYIIARVDVTDWDRYREYTKATPAAIEHFGGRFIVRGGEMITLEGPEETRRLVVIEFPSLEDLPFRLRKVTVVDAVCPIIWPFGDLPKA